MSTNKSDLVLDLTDEEELLLMREAHKRDITLNQLVEQILEEQINNILGSKQLNLFD